MFDDLPDLPDLSDLPEVEWDDTPTSPAAIASMVAQIWTHGDAEDRRMIDRMLAEQRQRERDEERDPRRHWYAYGERLKWVRPAVWLGDPDRDPRKMDFR